MRQRILFVLLFSAFLFFCGSQAFSAAMTQGSDVEYLTAKPLDDAVKGRLQPVVRGKLHLPLITWGGDVATIYADSEGFFREKGLDLELFTENDFAKQVEAVLAGKTPYLRGTMGMINFAAPVFEKQGTGLVVVYQLTWSTGGDCIVVRENIRTPADLKGKTIGLQYSGPHMDYIANVIRSAGLKLSDVKIKWLKELTLPGYDTRGKIVDPVSAFQNDNTLDAVMVISPDAMLLTSGGATGTGAEGSVKGAKILLTTKTASRIIADVYAVRKDWFDAHRDEVQKLVYVLMLGRERLHELMNSKTQNHTKYNALLAKSADMLLGSAQATGDVEGLLADCESVHHHGNVAFFTGVGTTRTLETLTEEIQSSFLNMNLMNKRADLVSAGWDYAALSGGLTNVGSAPAVPKFDPKKVVPKITADAESEDFFADGTLFFKEMLFKPNQAEFKEEDYAADFEVAIKMIETYGGSLVVVEGHADPLGIRRAEQRGENQTVIEQMKQQAKNLSLKRSRAVLDGFMAYCKKKGLEMDESQFVPLGIGTRTPKYPEPRTKDEWAQNMRVVFRIKQVEAELSDFAPLED